MSDLEVGETTDATERRRLFTTFAFLVSKQGATAVLGLAYWALATHLFRARDVGLAAAASATTANDFVPIQFYQIWDGDRVFGGLITLTRHVGALPRPWKEPGGHRA